MYATTTTAPTAIRSRRIASREAIGHFVAVSLAREEVAVVELALVDEHVRVRVRRGREVPLPDPLADPRPGHPAEVEQRDAPVPQVVRTQRGIAAARPQCHPPVPDACAFSGHGAVCGLQRCASVPVSPDHWREVEPRRCLGTRSVVNAKQLAAFLSVAALVALVPARSAEAKFSITLALQPKRPIAGQPVRVVMRTGASLPKKHGLKLTAIGPWRTSFGQTFFDVRLVRLGPRQFTATVRFPYSGRWRLIVPNWGAPGSAYPPPVDLPVRVRPRG